MSKKFAFTSPSFPILPLTNSFMGLLHIDPPLPISFIASSSRLICQPNRSRIHEKFINLTNFNISIGQIRDPPPIPTHKIFGSISDLSIKNPRIMIIIIIIINIFIIFPIFQRACLPPLEWDTELAETAQVRGNLQQIFFIQKS